MFALTIATGEKRQLTFPSNRNNGDRSGALSADGTTLAFVRTCKWLPDGEMYLQRLDGSKPVRLIECQPYMVRPVWLPDGSGLLYTGGTGYERRIMRVSLSGGTPDEIVQKPGILPSIAPDGKTVAFSSVARDVNIWRVPGPAAENLKPELRIPVKLIASTHTEQSPDISPDQKHILFVSDRTGGPEDWICDWNGRNAMQLTFKSFRGGTPRWSADGSEIITGWLRVLSPEGRPRRILAPGGAGTYRWSRDGKWVYFTSRRSGTPQIWKVPAAGGTPVRLTRVGGGDAAESDDGRFIYFVRSPERGIWRVRSDATPETADETLVTPQGTLEHFAAAPGGLCILNRDRPEGPTLDYFSLRTGRTTVVARLPDAARRMTGGSALAVSRDGKWALYTQLDHFTSDIVLLENFR